MRQLSQPKPTVPTLPARECCAATQAPWPFGTPMWMKMAGTRLSPTQAILRGRLQSTHGCPLRLSAISNRQLAIRNPQSAKGPTRWTHWHAACNTFSKEVAQVDIMLIVIALIVGFSAGVAIAVPAMAALSCRAYERGSRDATSMPGAGLR